MSATQHTPGPWSLEEGNPLTVVHEDGGDYPWFITTTHVGFAPGVAEANARLIAAAPDMLAALHAMEKASTFQAVSDALILGREVIEKAEGRS